MGTYNKFYDKNIFPILKEENFIFCELKEKFVVFKISFIKGYTCNVIGYNEIKENTESESLVFKVIANVKNNTITLRKELPLFILKQIIIPFRNIYDDMWDEFEKTFTDLLNQTK